MARTISSNIETQSQQEEIRIAHLLKLKNLGNSGGSTTTVNVTNHVKNIVYNDGTDNLTYEAGGNFLDIGAVEESGSLEYSSINVSLKNVTTTVRDLFKNQDYINKEATIFLVFLDSTEQVIDVYEYFKGTVAGATLSVANGNFSVDIELSSHWKNWDVKNGRKFTQASQTEFCTKNSLGSDLGLAFAHLTNSDVRWNR
tara:strand:- start:1671 stop:2267 length:597 start_codon:yes stop_codon:yes gene_type:complete